MKCCHKRSDQMFCLCFWCETSVNEIQHFIDMDNSHMGKYWANNSSNSFTLKTTSYSISIKSYCDCGGGLD